MPIRRILGQSATVTEAGVPDATTASAVHEDAPVVEEESNATGAAGGEVTSQETHKVHSKFINHLETYQGLGAIVEPTGDLLAPSVLYVKSLFPDAVVNAIKSVDVLLDDTLTSIDNSVVPVSLRRTPTHKGVSS